MKTNGSRGLDTMIARVEASGAALVKRQETENIAAMNRQNLAMVKCQPAQPAIAGESLTGARRLTEAEQDEMHAERTAARLARFGDKAGKHGALARCTRAMLLRLPRDTALAFDQIAAHVGSRPTTLVTQLAMIAGRCDPENWFAVMTAFQRAASGGIIKR